MFGRNDSDDNSLNSDQEDGSGDKKTDEEVKKSLDEVLAGEMKTVSSEIVINYNNKEDGVEATEDKTRMKARINFFGPDYEASREELQVTY